MQKWTIGLLFAWCTLGPSSATSEPNELAAHYAAQGLAAAERGFQGYASLCNLESRIRNVNVPRPQRAENSRRTEGVSESQPRRTRLEPRASLEPLRVFDNLYFLGTPMVTAWLYGTEAGYILIDGLTHDEEAQRVILDGMAHLGLDPQAIEYVLITHGHGDHYGGADYLAATLGVDLLMSKADWDLVATLGTHPRFGPPPPRGTDVTDGQVIKFGTSEVTIHLAPGHTPGTLAPICEVIDGTERHMAVLWGGTGFNFGPDAQIFETYAASAAKMRSQGEKDGVDVILSNHSRRAGTIEKMAALKSRTQDQTHPFVQGDAGYALFDVLENCALAQAARFAE